MNRVKRKKARVNYGVYFRKENTKRKRANKQIQTDYYKNKNRSSDQK